MQKITYENLRYSNFGNCLKISNGVIEAIVTLDVGPRVIRFGLVGKENMLFEDTDRNMKNSGDVIEAVFGKGSEFYNYGGHRLWMSPEDMPLTYYPDNDPVQYEKIENGVLLTPPPQRINDVQVKIEISMPEGKNKLSLKHYITNIGDTTKTKSAWSLTVLGQGGLEIVPQPQNDTGLLPNRVLSLWPYTDLSDDRVFWGKKYITLRQDKEIASAFKIGINNLREWAAYINHGCMFIKRYKNNPAGNYPDFGTSFETYTNNFIIEMETIGEITNITPGSTIFHSEEWEIVGNVDRPEPNDEITIDTLVKMYIEK